MKIYDDFGDGRRILEVMQKIGKFEEIDSIMTRDKGVVVKSRKRKTDAHPGIQMNKETLTFWDKVKLKIKRCKH